MHIRCPKCSSENLIAVDAHYFWNLFIIRVLKRKPPKLNLKKQKIRCIDCGKIFSMFDV